MNMFDTTVMGAGNLCVPAGFVAYNKAYGFVYLQLCA